MTRWALLCCCALLLAGEELPRPGWPEPLAAVELPPPAWDRRDGALIALADDGGERWRRELLPGARLWTGPGGALLADDRGLRWLDAAGGERLLPPLPADIMPLGVDGPVAAFAQDDVGWLFAAGAAAVHLALPGRPLGAPLAAGRTCLWLTMHHLVWWDGGTPAAHRHGLPVGLGWSLARDRAGRPLVLAPDRRAWAIPAWRPGPDDERLGLPVATTPEADRATRMRHALRRGDWDAAGLIAAGTAERAALALYAGWPPPPGAEALAPLPRDPGELLLSEPAWSAALAPRARPLPRPGAPARRAEPPLADAPVAAPAPPAPLQRTRDGLVDGLRAWQVHDDGERTTAACRDDGRLRWYVRWLSEEGLTVPGRSLVLEAGRLLIAEGEARLLVLDAGTGAVELDARPRRLPLLPGRTWPRPDGVVILFPPGRDDRLGWLGADGTERDEFLPAPARWCLVLPDGEVWLALTDGRALAGTARGAWRPLALPAALIAAPEARLVDGGVAAGEQLWRWRE